jgi:hypothetical protein
MSRPGLPPGLLAATPSRAPDLGLHPLHVVSARLLEGVTPIVTRLPGVVALGYAVMARSTRIQERTATVAVTSVGVAFALAPMSLMWVVVGGHVPAAPAGT